MAHGNHYLFPQEDMRTIGYPRASLWSGATNLRSVDIRRWLICVTTGSKGGNHKHDFGSSNVENSVSILVGSKDIDGNPKEDRLDFGRR